MANERGTGSTQLVVVTLLAEGSVNNKHIL